ncbi:MAG: protein kinase domain-containing protein, partial [bacterium]
FEREARAVSSLNHPHICTLHDVGREGETDYLVMELVEGETLAARLERGALPTSEVLRLGAQIADALDRAHRAGIVHRDLKPANVMLTKSGAKLMDFGLARATGAAGLAGSGTSVTIAALSQSPTVSRPLTAEGTIVGTFQYMSPEQMEGKEADARSDLWALGCVLYEMATGRRAFEAKSQASLIGAIMHAQPAPVSQVAAMSPLALDRLVGACLAKDPADRVQSAHDVKLQLDWMAEGASPASGVSAAAAPALPAARRAPRPLAFGLVALGAAAATALVMSFVLRKSADAPRAEQRYIVALADLSPSCTPVIAPDGESVVFAARAAGVDRLYRRYLNSFEASVIPGTEDGKAPFFSPDGAWIGFVTLDAIKKVPVAGGVAQTVASEARVASADWGADGMIYFTQRVGGADGLTALSRVLATGGRVEAIAALDSAAGESEAWLPEILPDGKTVLISILGSTSNTWEIVAIRPEGARQRILTGGFLGRYVAPGHLVYYDFDSELVLAAPFDPEKLEITGPALPLTEQVSANFAFDVSGDGKLLYVPQPGAGTGDELIWLDRKGAATPALDTRSSWVQPRVSPDGRRVLARKSATECELWILDTYRGSMARIAQGSDNHDPVWSPDGRRIAFQKLNARGEMVTLSVQGPREVATIPNDQGAGAPQSWVAGGNLFAFTVTGRGTGSDIWVRAMDGDAPSQPFLATEFNETDAAISPDGRFIAYTSNEGGIVEVFIRPYPDTGTAWQVSAGGGESPLWSRDGRELFFVSGTKMMAVSIETRPTFEMGTPVVLFDGGFSTGGGRDFDVALDGRFLAVRSAGGDRGALELRMLLDWPEAMKRTSGAQSH